MHCVEPRIFLLAKTQVDRSEVRKWLDFKGAEEFDIPPPEACSDASLLVTLAGKRCYMSFEPGLNPNVTKVRTDMADFIENILSVGHGSVLEHVTFTFAIENVSRVFTGEMNRHRAGMAISEGSMRFIRYEDIPFWMPTSIGEESEKDTSEVIQKKLESRAVFLKAFTQAERQYAQLEKIWKEELAPTSKFYGKKQITSMMRRIIGMGIASGGLWTGNIRALRHIFTMRCAKSAEEEILMVANMMLETMIKEEPNFFGDFEKVKGYYRPKYDKV